MARSTLPDRLRLLLLSHRARPLRFAAVGGAAALLQLALLLWLTHLGLAPLPANVSAYLVSAQCNFVLSSLVIWPDRWTPGTNGRAIARAWVAFHLSIAGSFVVSQLVFVLARTAVPNLAASAAGIGSAAVLNFLLQDRYAFQRGRTGAGATRVRRREAEPTRPDLAKSA